MPPVTGASAFKHRNTAFMRRLYLLAGLFLLVFYGCVQSPGTPAYLHTGNLPGQLFVIRLAADTTVETTGGIRIHIAANAIVAEARQVTLVVREALNPEQMLWAGLTTASDQGLLRSDGMFSITTREKATIRIPLQVSLPTAYADPAMQLYTGEEQSGKIKWKDPVPVAARDSVPIITGASLFTTKCAGCHGIDKVLTGPALGGVTQRQSRDWLYRWTRNWPELVGSGDPDACRIKNFSPSTMPIFKELSREEIDRIYDYIERESKRLGIFSSPDSLSEVYLANKKYLDRLLDKRDSLLAANGKANQPDSINNRAVLPADTTGPESELTYTSRGTEYYQVQIRAFGWFNIDALMGDATAPQSELTVSVSGVTTAEIDIYLAIPDRKLLASGELLADGKRYGFNGSSGLLPLPQNNLACIVAIAEENGKLYYGEARFTTARAQNITLVMKETSKVQLVQNFRRMNLKNVVHEVEDIRNDSSLLQINKAIKSTRIKLQQLNGCEPPEEFILK
jgi:mono/diheme cytochrome c family protein